MGPTFVDIANKYRDQPHQLELSVTRVMQGSTGVWGKVAMLPHSQHTREQVTQMVEYVFSVKADSSTRVHAVFEMSWFSETDGLDSFWRPLTRTWGVERSQRFQ